MEKDDLSDLEVELVPLQRPDGVAALEELTGGLKAIEKVEIGEFKKPEKILKELRKGKRIYKRRPGPKYLHHTVRKRRYKERMAKYYREVTVFNRQGRSVWERWKESCDHKGLELKVTEEELREELLAVGIRLEDLVAVRMERYDKQAKEVTLEGITLRTREGNILLDGAELRMRRLGYIL